MSLHTTRTLISEYSCIISCFTNTLIFNQNFHRIFCTSSPTRLSSSARSTSWNHRPTRRALYRKKNKGSLSSERSESPTDKVSRETIVIEDIMETLGIVKIYNQCHIKVHAVFSPEAYGVWVPYGLATTCILCTMLYTHSCIHVTNTVYIYIGTLLSCLCSICRWPVVAARKIFKSLRALPPLKR